MQVFTARELQRHPSEVHQSALTEPTFITFRGRPKLVVLSIDEFERLRGRGHTVLHAAELSEGILAGLQQIADEFPVEDADLNLIGGLLDETPAARTR